MFRMSESDPQPNKDYCVCGEPAAHECSRCKKKVCDDNNCGQDTVDGYLCGTYTQWGCGRKYTTCDTCLDDKAIHEENLNYCDICSNSICDTCMEDTFCSKCEGIYCGDCIDDHVEECDN
jgi:hypothetical protein